MADTDMALKDLVFNEFERRTRNTVTGRITEAMERTFPDGFPRRSTRVDLGALQMRSPVENTHYRPSVLDIMYEGVPAGATRCLENPIYLPRSMIILPFSSAVLLGPDYMDEKLDERFPRFTDRLAESLGGIGYHVNINDISGENFVELYREGRNPTLYRLGRRF